MDAYHWSLLWMIITVVLWWMLVAIAGIIITLIISRTNKPTSYIVRGRRTRAGHAQ